MIINHCGRLGSTWYVPGLFRLFHNGFPLQKWDSCSVYGIYIVYFVRDYVGGCV